MAHLRLTNERIPNDWSTRARRAFPAHVYIGAGSRGLGQNALASMQMLRLLLLLCAGSAAAGAYTCPAYCASQTRAGDCQAGEDAVLRAACVCDWVYRGSTRGCVRDFGGFVCDGKQVPPPLPRPPPTASPPEHA